MNFKTLSTALICSAAIAGCFTTTIAFAGSSTVPGHTLQPNQTKEYHTNKLRLRDYTYRCTVRAPLETPVDEASVLDIVATKKMVVINNSQVLLATGNNLVTLKDMFPGQSFIAYVQNHGGGFRVTNKSNHAINIDCRGA